LLSLSNPAHIFKMTSRHTYPQCDDFSVISADTDAGTTDRVTYLSKNSDGRQFEAVSPPNSVHSQKLAELAMLVQSNPRQSKSHKKALPALGRSSSRRVAQIAPVAYQETPYGVHQMSSPADQRVVYESTTPQTSGIVSSGPATSSSQVQPPYATYNSAQPYSQPQSGQETSYEQQQYHQYQEPEPLSTQYAVAPPQEPRPYVSDLHQRPVNPNQHYQAPEVHRYATEQQMGYSMKATTGEVRVSAPVGSREAIAFDGLADKVSSKKDRRDDKERRAVKRISQKEYERKGSGWGWGW